MSNLRIAMGQLNFLVGDVEGNCAKIIQQANEAKSTLQADLLVVSELALTGYPPEDLLLRPDLHRLVKTHLSRLAASVTDIDLLVGYPAQVDDKIYNAAAYIQQGKVIENYFKRHLPNYGVFDEKRYFTPGNATTVVDCKGIKLGVVICEDLWRQQPYEETVAAGADLVLSINASPFDFDKANQREKIMSQHIAQHHVPIIYVHGVGGQDELVFDGGSLCMDANGTITHQAQHYEETLLPIDVDLASKKIHPGYIAPKQTIEEKIYQALCLGLKDYIYKNGFTGALLGLSGGIDSALTLAIAYDALGAANVQAVMLPSRHTSQMSLDDARTMADNLSIKYSEISIEPCFKAFLDVLQDEFSGLTQDTTEENIQARCRGVILMAISNKSHKLLLTTGNKSEVAVGYTTLYGDMAGSFSVLKDVPKTLVYNLSNYRNHVSTVIPQRIIDRPPSAELAPDQMDEDSLPPYTILDQILERYVERDQSIANITAAGFDEEIVRHVIALVDRNEYKRRQAAPGVRITQRAFGRDRRYPITSGFSHDITTEGQYEKN